MEREIIREKTLCTDITLIFIGTGAHQTTYSCCNIYSSRGAIIKEAIFSIFFFSASKIFLHLM